MDTLTQIGRWLVWVVAMQVANLPIPVVHDHAWLHHDSIMMHVTAHHDEKAAVDIEGWHVHFCFLLPFGQHAQDSQDDSHDPALPTCPSEHRVLADPEIELDIKGRMARGWDISLAAFFSDAHGVLDPLPSTRASHRGQAHAAGASSWQPVNGVMLV